MAVTFLHTADWQLGKPYGWVADNEQQIRLRDARFEVIDRLGEIARQEGARFVVVAGDVFDSNRPSANTIATALGKIGQIGQNAKKTNKNFSMHEIAGFGINQNPVITLANFSD